MKETKLSQQDKDDLADKVTDSIFTGIMLYPFICLGLLILSECILRPFIGLFF